MALTLDASNDDITFPAGGSLDDIPAGPYTAYCLVRPTANITTEQQLINKMGVGWVGSMFLSLNNQNRLFSLVTTDGNVFYTESVNDSIVVNSWNVAIATYAGSLAAPKLYIATLGNLPVEPSYNIQQSGTGLRGADTSFALTLGTRETNDGTRYGGQLGPCALWKRVITADEIKALGLGFVPLFFPQDLVFYCEVTGRLSSELNRAPLTAVGTAMAGTVNGGPAFATGPSIIIPRWAHRYPRSSGNVYVLTAASGAYVLSGTVASLNKGRLVVAAAGAYTLTGTAVGLLVGRVIVAAGASYVLTGTVAGLLFKRLLTAASATYSLAGSVVGLLKGRTLAANAGSYVLSGTAAGLIVTRLLAAASGAYSLVGSIVSLVYSGAPPVIADVFDFINLLRRRRK